MATGTVADCRPSPGFSPFQIHDHLVPTAFVYTESLAPAAVSTRHGRGRRSSSRETHRACRAIPELCIVLRTGSLIKDIGRVATFGLHFDYGSAIVAIGYFYSGGL